MVLSLNGMGSTQKDEAPKGEMRLDADNKGYWYSFKNEKAKVVSPEPVAIKEVKRKLFGRKK